jgi:cell division protein ZapA
MPLVNVLVNSRAYTIACDDGEEDHVRELGEHLDRRVRELVSSVGQVGESRLLIMAGIIIADELAEALTKLHAREKEIAALKSGGAVSVEQLQGLEERAAAALESAAARVEAIAAGLSRP